MKTAKPYWDDTGRLVSDLYSDVYFTGDDGIEEGLHIFIKGNGLPGRWKDRKSFRIIETGFGTGLNFLITWDLWKKFTEPDAVLEYYSVEKHPIPAEHLKKIHEKWPEFSSLSEKLISAYPDTTPGMHEVKIDDGNVRLFLLFDDAKNIERLETTADAWFLDGFSPASNPEMWSFELVEKIKKMTKPGGTFATFTSASDVRSAFERNGFIITRDTGFASKKHMLKGMLTKKNGIERNAHGTEAKMPPECGSLFNAIPEDLMSEDYQKVFISADQLEKDSWMFAKSIFETGYDFDVFAGITRGGAQIAIYMQEVFELLTKKKKKFATIHASSYKGLGEASEVTVGSIDALISVTRNGDKILVVDDIFDRGSTFDAVTETIKKRMPKKDFIVYKAAMYYKPHNRLVEMEPDFYHRAYATSDWIVLPHELSHLTEEELRMKGFEI